MFSTDKYRRIVIVCVEIFLCAMLYVALESRDPVNAGAYWPLTVSIIVVLMLPEKRFTARAFIALIDAIKGRSVK